MEKQKAVNEELARLKADMERMEKELKEKKTKLNELEEDLAIKKANLEIAEKLVSGLGDEKISWNAEKKQLGIMYEKLVGDAMLSCAFLT
jgi:dynein heavy chain